MKNKILSGLLSLGLLVMVASCDNGNADPVVIDIEPSIAFGDMAGLVEGDTYTISVTFTDGAAGSSISTLANASWSIVSGGTEVASGTLTPTGDEWTGDITASGLTAGNYTLNVTATDTNGNSGSASIDFTIAAAIPNITGDWTMEPVEASLAVGPSAGSADWWFVPAAEVTGVRACFFDDVFTFAPDGTFSYNQGAQTFVEGWQGGGDSCGAPVAPFDGSGSYGYTFNGSTLRLTGAGAYLGLPKVNNQGEISQGAPVSSDITYDVAEFTEAGGVRRMKLIIEAGNGVFWTFLLISQ